MSVQQAQIQDEWVNILTKGLITIPKKMRDKLGLKEGDVAKIKIEEKRIVIEPRTSKTFEEVRLYTQEEIEAFIKEDELGEVEQNIVTEFWKNLP